MHPKKKLPEGSEEMARSGGYILVKYDLEKKPFYSVFRFYETSGGTRYVPRGGGSRDLDEVKRQLERITGVKHVPEASDAKGDMKTAPNGLS
jgi:hypothetical protein